MKRLFLFLVIAGLLAACQGVVPELSMQSPPAAEQMLTPTPYFYAVKSGDTIWSIARKTGLDVETLVAANELKRPDEIHPGDKLLISSKRSISGRLLPTPTATPIPCLHGCVQPPSGCAIKGYHARLDGMKLYVTPEDEIYALPQADIWFCRQQDARDSGWLHWTPTGPKSE